MDDMSNNLSNDDLRDHLGHDFDIEDINSQTPFQLVNNACKYYELEDLNALSSQPRHSAVHINVQSLPAKYEQLKLFIDKLMDSRLPCLQVDYILLCETFLTQANYDKYPIPGYDFICKYRRAIKRGGVGIYIRNDIPNKLRDLSLFIEGEFESIFIETTSPTDNVLIGEMYRIPNTNEQQSLQTFGELFDKLSGQHKNVIFGGDQNFDFLKINSHGATPDLSNKAFSSGLLPTITKPTRITHSSATLIDNIYINSVLANGTISLGIIVSDISHHPPVFMFLGKNIKTSTIKV